MGANKVVKRGLVRSFVVFTAIAVALNVVAAVEAFQRETWSIGFGYLLIAAGLSAALLVHWYTSHRQTPYKWRSGNTGRDGDGDGETSVVYDELDAAPADHEDDLQDRFADYDRYWRELEQSGAVTQDDIDLHERYKRYWREERG